MISDNFQAREFEVSGMADSMGYDFNMDRYEIENIVRLVNLCLQPARESIGKPFKITSGFRPAWLNRLIGGSKNSRHMFGCAADFVVPGTDLAQVFKRIKALDLPIDQLILEHPETPGGWIHLGIALPGQEPRKQYMIATRTADGKTVYRNAE